MSGSPAPSTPTVYRRGLLPDQVRYLKERMWIGALRQFHDAAKGNVHLPGNYVLRNLNLAFGYDGWSVEILKSHEVFKEKIDKDGKTLFRVIWSTEVRLTIHTPGGADFSRTGVGADEGVSSSMVDCYKKAPAGALTYAIKNAAITLGDQFGLRVIRAGKDENAKPYNWRTRTQPNHPIPPDLSGIKATDHDLSMDEGGDDDELPPDDGGQQSQGQREERRPQQQEQRREEPREQQRETQRSGAPSNDGADRTERLEPRQQERPAEQRREEPRQQEQQSNGGPPVDRGATVTACRAAWSKIGRERAEPIYAGIAKKYGYEQPFVTIGRPVGTGGPPDEMLGVLRTALEGAVQ